MNRRQFHQTLTAMLPAAALAQAQQSPNQHPGTTKERTHMQIVDKRMRFQMAVSDMPKAKAFYAGQAWFEGRDGLP
jgi:hypothetical protein